MGSQITGLRVASAVFGLVCLAQMTRLIMGTNVVVAGFILPLWPSAVASVVTGLLCIWLLSLSAPPRGSGGRRTRPRSS